MAALQQMKLTFGLPLKNKRRKEKKQPMKEVMKLDFMAAHHVVDAWLVFINE